MPNKRDIGQARETEAIAYFERKEWELLCRNFSCRLGEVDLIFMEPKGTIVFVEVKFRSSNDFGFGQEFVGPLKQARVTKAAIFFIRQMADSFSFCPARSFPFRKKSIPFEFMVNYG